MYLIVSLVFSHLGFWSGSLFLIAPFPDLCLLVLFSVRLCLIAVEIPQLSKTSYNFKDKSLKLLISSLLGTISRAESRVSRISILSCISY